MEPSTYIVPKGAVHTHEPWLRDLIRVLQRRWRMVAITFAAVMGAVLVSLLFMPTIYHAEMKVLVKRDRSDAPVSAGAETQTRSVRGVSEQELNSEVDLLKSRDLLEKVVLATALHQERPARGWRAWWGSSPEVSEEMRVAKAVEGLRGRVTVQALDKSQLIRVRYEDEDPQRAAKVLNALWTLYMDKHVAVHRPPGTTDFFQKQADDYHRQLAQIKAQLREFERSEGVIAAESEKASALQKGAEFEAERQQIQAAIAATRQRIGELEKQRAATPTRITTEVRVNSSMVSDLRTKLYELQQKRTELLQKFDPGYRLVRDVDEQIATTRASIADAEKAPVSDEITDRNPTHEWLEGELSKARAEIAGLRARNAAISRSLTHYRSQALSLSEKEARQQELLLAAKAAEENYSLYSRKREEARMSEALDQQRIVNVAMAEAPTVPFTPSSSPLNRMAMGLLLALGAGVGLAFVAEYMDPSFRSPYEVEAYLAIPVLAALPHQQKSLIGGHAVAAQQDGQE